MENLRASYALILLSSLALMLYPATTLSVGKAQPKKTSQFFSSESESQIEEITEESIAELESLIQRFSRSKRRGELWLRLAELFVEKSRVEETRAFKKFDQRVDAYNAGKIKQRPKVNLNLSKSYNKKAIGLYEKFIRYFPNDPRVDKALFFLGFNHLALGRIQRGAIFYRQLSQNHPDSPYVSESNFALGEYHFDRDEWRTARGYYQKVASDKTARLYLFSVYKMAWCDYRTGNYQEALFGMEQVLGESRKKRRSNNLDGRKSLNRTSLVTEAINDLIPFFADSKANYRKAYTYLRKIAGERIGLRLLEKLAYYYSDTGQKEAARHNFLLLIEKKPLSPRTFDYQYQIVNNFMFSNDSSVVEKELSRWIRDYGQGSAWYEANKGNPTILKDSETVRESTLRNFVLQNHQNAKDSRQEYSQKLALRGYSLYLKSFPRSKHRDQMIFYYGDLLFDVKKYDLAAKQFAWIIKNAPKSDYLEPAIINAVIGLEKSLPSEKEIEKTVGQKLRPVAFTGEIKSFEGITKKYLKTFPQGEKKTPITFKLARLYYLHNQWNKALPGFKYVVKKQPKSKIGIYSANSIIDIYGRMKDYEGLKKAGKEILDAGVSSKATNDIKGIIEKSTFKTAQDLASAGSYMASAKGFEKFHFANPKSVLAMSALFNAAANYQKAGDISSSVRLFGRFSESRAKKNKKQSFQANETLPSLYIDLGQYMKAAESYVRLYEKYPKNKKASKWLFNAATIWQNLEVWTFSIRDFKRFYQKERKKERENAWFSIGEIYEKKRQPTLAITAYNKFLSHNPSSAEKLVEAHSRLSDIYRNRRDMRRALREDKKLISLGKTFDRKSISYPRELVGQAIFRKYVNDYDKFRSIRMPSGAKAQQKAITQKIKNLERVKKNFSKVIAFKETKSTVKSLLHLARAHNEVYKYLHSVPEPKGLSAAEKKEYKKQLKKQTEPFVSVATKYYRDAIDVSRKQSTYTSDTRAAIKEISRLKGSGERYFGETIFRGQTIDWVAM